MVEKRIPLPLNKEKESLPRMERLALPFILTKAESPVFSEYHSIGLKL